MDDRTGSNRKRNRAVGRPRIVERLDADRHTPFLVVDDPRETLSRPMVGWREQGHLVRFPGPAAPRHGREIGKVACRARQKAHHTNRHVGTSRSGAISRNRRRARPRHRGLLPGPARRVFVRHRRRESVPRCLVRCPRHPPRPRKYVPQRRRRWPPATSSPGSRCSQD